MGGEMQLAAFAIAFIFFSCVEVIGVGAQQVKVDSAAKPLVTTGGANTAIKKAFAERINTSDEWTHIWARHLGLPSDDQSSVKMQVDFTRCTAVAMFLGKQIQVRGITIESVQETSSSIVVRFRKVSYSIGRTGTTPPPSEISYPYAFVILPKTAKEIILEEDLRGKDDLIDSPWKGQVWAKIKSAKARSSNP
jgi:hypothetical protein